jgi:hypothetical protein
MVEYSLLLTAVAVPTSIGVIQGGKAMVKLYVEARDAVLSPQP